MDLFILYLINCFKKLAQYNNNNFLLFYINTRCILTLLL